MTRSPAQRSLDAEVRGVESGHRAFVQDDGSVKVVSDTHPGKHYVVSFTALAAGDLVTFSCRPVGNHAYDDDHLDLTGTPGCLPCMHAAVAARRLEREGLADRGWTADRWVASAKAAEVTASRLPAPAADPFDGLPGAEERRPLPPPEQVDPADAKAGRDLFRSL